MYGTFGDLDHGEPNGAIGAFGTTLLRHDATITRLAFHPRGHQFATASRDGTINLWGLEYRNRVQRFRAHTFAFGPKGNLFAVASKQNVEIFKLSDLRRIHIFAAKHLVGGALAFSPNAQYLAAGHTLFHIRTKRRIQLRGPVERGVAEVFFTPDSSRLVSVDGLRARVWDAITGRLNHTFRHPQYNNETLWSAMLHPNGRSLIVSSGMKMTRSLVEWDLVTGNKTRKHEHTISRLAQAGSEPSLLYKGECQPVEDSMATFSKLKRIQTKTVVKPVGKCFRQGAEVDNLWSLNSTGTLLATGSDDKALRLWKVSTGQLLARLRTFSQPISGLAFSPDGKTLVACAGSQITLWTTSTRKQRTRPVYNHITTMALSDKGHLLATAGSGSVQIWNAATGQPVGKALQLDVVVRKVRFFGERRVLLFHGGGADKYGLIWLHLDESGAIVGRQVTPLLQGQEPQVALMDHRFLWNFEQVHEDWTLLPPKWLLLTPVDAFNRTPNTVLFDANTGRFVRNLMRRLNPLFTSTDKGALWGQLDAKVLMISISDGKILWSANLPKTSDAFDWKVAGATSGKWLVVASSQDPTQERPNPGCKNRVDIWQRAQPENHRRALCHPGAWLRAVAVHAKRQIFATGSADGTIRVWSLKTLQPRYIYRDPDSSPRELVFSPDGKRLYSRQGTGNVLVWPVP